MRTTPSCPAWPAEPDTYTAVDDTPMNRSPLEDIYVWIVAGLGLVCWLIIVVVVSSCMAS
jgi:hypothetical protein